MNSILARRQFISTGLSCFAMGLSHGRAQEFAPVVLPPTRTITKGPGFHWFGYYDKLQFDPTNRFVLGNKVQFEHRSPRADDEIEVGMVDLHDHDRWIPLGNSRAWNWQQGCMLQWIPGSDSNVIWNDRQQDRFVSHILDIKTGDKNTIPSPIYSLNPDGKSAVSCDFSRVADVRPGYGYAGIPDPFANDMAPEGSGITHVNLQTGEAQLIISHWTLARTGPIPNNSPDVKHHAYHLLCSPDGQRFILLHRWLFPSGQRLTRLITANMDGSDMRIVIPNGYASHFIWRDSTHILSQSKDWLGNDQWSNFLFEDKDAGIIEEVGKGVLDPSGHFSYFHNNEWILSDTYPIGAKRLQTPHLYHLATQRRIDLGSFPSPAVYTGEWRVDTHPRLSRDEQMVCIDSPHGDEGRQLHVIDIKGLVI